MDIRARLKKQTLTLQVTPISEKTIKIKSRFHPEIVEEIKALEGARWDPEAKTWSASYSERNLYSLTSLERNDQRFCLFVSLPEDFLKDTKLMKHQREMVLQMLARNRVIIAGEMGTGKTFAAISLMEKIAEQTPEQSYFWILTPKSAKYSWESEMKKWHCSFQEWSPNSPSQKTYRFCSYNSLEKLVTETPEEFRPDHVIFDEAHLLKNAEAKRTQAALILTSLLRAKSERSCIVLLTGTPSPKDPTDWWALTELCQAGYLRESNRHKLANRLGTFATNVGQAGQEYKKLLSWKPEELQTLKHRLKGLVHVYLKKDCLDLPDKIYVPVFLPFDKSMQQQIQLLITMQGKGVTALAKLRQRSDGFQYHSVCSRCSGEGRIPFLLSRTTSVNFNSPSFEEDKKKEQRYEMTECSECSGSGESVLSVPTPKDERLIYDLEELEGNEKDRVVIYAGFHKSIDKIFEILQARNWGVIRLDGRGLLCSPGIDPKDWQNSWNNSKENIAFLGHPKAGGLGLNLQKSETLIFYSNDFDGASRPQAEDRIHRIGTTKARILDYLWLPTDYYILGNLKEKRNLQGVTIGELENYVKTFSQEKFYAF